MKNILEKFIPKPKYFLGLDIGASQIKAVEIKKNNDSFQVTKVGAVDTPSGAIEDGKIQNGEALTSALEKLIADNSFQTKEAVILVNGNSVITREIPIPVMEEKEIVSALKYEAERYIPIPIEDLIIDYIILGEEEGEEGPQYNLLLVAVPQQLIYEYYDLLVGVGITPVAVEIIPTVLWRLFSAFKKIELHETGGQVFVDIGTRVTNLVVFFNDKLSYSRTIPYGGEQITESISQTFMLGLEEAEGFKKLEGKIIVDDGDENYKSTEIQTDLAIRSGLSGLIHEVQRSIDFFRLKNKTSTMDSAQLVKKVYILGGTSKIDGISDFFEAELGVKVEKLEKEFFHGTNLVTFKSQLWDKFDTTSTLALGLALREVVS